MTKRLLCIVLAICMLSGTVSLLSCSHKKGEQISKITLNDSYTIITGAELDAAQSTAAKALYDALGAEGISVETGRDSEVEKGDFEILVGQTNRNESQKAYEKLEKIDDFIIDPISDKVIVICGKTPIATEAAVEYFLKEYVRAGTGEFKKELFVGGKTLFQKEYAYESVNLEDVAIKDYVIAIENDNQTYNAYKIAHVLGAYSGEVADIVKYSELTDKNRGVVCLGASSRDTTAPLPEGLDGFFLNLTTGDDGVTIAVDWSDEYNVEKAIETFGERFAASGEEKVGKGRFTSITKHKFQNVGALNSAVWKVESTVQNYDSEGMTQITYKCTGYQGLPYLVHVMTVDLDHVSLMLGTADNLHHGEDRWVQTPVQHARAAIKAGHNVIGTINAGYPQGISVKEGYLMVPGTIHRPYFAVTKSGEPQILYDDNAADIENLDLAACGTHVIVDNYMPGDLKMDEEFSYTTHPRTLIGIRGDGKVVFVVIDGRQPELSNGSPMVRSADIMMKLGCKMAINMDGGGSSSMTVRHSSGAFKIVNKISDPVMRSVRNSVMVIAPSEGN